jgi:N-acyl-D-aspartate/D-glutamate deacylase
MHDLVIRNATIVDGTGNDRFSGDVAIEDGKIVAVGEVTGKGKTEIEAEGNILAPGWVDVHTHYDGQATWDPYVTPSSWHGVTTVVMGNCGVGFAPVRPGEEQNLIEMMEAVEDIPGTALAEGIDWKWESFPEYLDALEAFPRAIDIGTQMPHSAIRAYVMGNEGSYRDVATEAEIDEMAAITREGLVAGALGFSTSRTILHRDKDGELIPGTNSTPEELLALGRTLGEVGHGVFEMVSDAMGRDPDLDWMKQFCKETGRPITFVVAQMDWDPDGWRDTLAQAAELVSEGIILRPQIPGRPTGMLMGFITSLHPFITHPTFKKIADLPHAELIAELKKPETRKQILSEKPTAEDGILAMLLGNFIKFFPIHDSPDYEPTKEQSVAERATALGVTPQELAYDLMLERDGQGYLFAPLGNYARFNHDHLREMLLDETTLLGLSDGGAHCGLIADASMPTFMLTHWVRDRSRGERIPLEKMVKIQSQDTAALYGLKDRGVIAPGMKADLNLIDLDALYLHPPTMVYDLPMSGRRIIQKVDGYLKTIVNGEITYEDGVATGALPGKLIRGPQTAVQI